MAQETSTHFRSYGGDLNEDIDQSVDAYARAIVASKCNITENTARVAIGEGFQVFIGLITEASSTALSKASMLSDRDWTTATARGLAILFRHHGVTSEDALRSKLDHLEEVKDRLLYPSGGESEEDGDEAEGGEA